MLYSLEHLLEAMPDTAFIYGPDLTILDIVNPQADVLLGIEVRQLIGIHLSKISVLSPLFKEAIDIFRKHIELTAETRQKYLFNYETVINGEKHYTQGRTVPFEKDKVICFVHDITGEMIAQQKVNKLENFLQSIIDNLPFPLLVKSVSDNFRYLYYNKCVFDFYDDKATDYAGKNDFEMNDPHAAQYREEDWAAVQSAIPLTFERILYDKENKPYKWGFVTKTKLTNNDGSQYILAIVKETTESIRHQEKLKSHIFKSNFVIKSNGIIQWDYDVQKREISSPNPESFVHHGISEELYFNAIHPDERQAVKHALEQICSGELAESKVDARLMTGKDTYCWIEIFGAAFEHDKEGNVTKITGLRKDITEDKKLTNELITLREKAEESNRLKSAFLANMSHEIRTPLNAIIGFSNLLTQTEDPEERKEYYQIIETNNELLLQLISDILDLSKIEAGYLDFSFSEVNLADIFHNLKQIYEYRISPNVEFLCEQPYCSCIIHTEKNRLTQVISNFLSNACKFTSQGFIKMGYEAVEGGLRFYVTDTGKGITKENVAKVFERFTKLDSFVQGTGLGLSICETIIHRLNGRIGAESEVGKGSSFWFYLPCEPVVE